MDKQTLITNLQLEWKDGGVFDLLMVESNQVKVKKVEKPILRKSSNESFIKKMNVLKHCFSNIVEIFARMKHGNFGSNGNTTLPFDKAINDQYLLILPEMLCV